MIIMNLENPLEKDNQERRNMRSSSASVEIDNGQRTQFVISKVRAKELEDLMEIADISTKKDLFNTALTMFEWAIGEKSNGNKIVSLDEDTGAYKELIMFPLQIAARRKAQNLNQGQTISEGSVSNKKFPIKKDHSKVPQ
jgi:hypothetical protein